VIDLSARASSPVRNVAPTAITTSGLPGSVQVGIGDLAEPVTARDVFGIARGLVIPNLKRSVRLTLDTDASVSPTANLPMSPQ